MKSIRTKNTKKTIRAAALLLACGVSGAASTRVLAQATNVYPTDVTNVAAAANGGRILSATSTLDNDAKFSADNLIDGQVYNAIAQSGSQGWASNKFDPINLDGVTIGFSDNTLRRIGRIVINPSSSVAPERWAKDIEVQVSTTSAEGPFTPVAQITLKREAVPQSFTILPAPARFVRLAFRTNWGSDRAVALGEVEMYEAIDKSDALGQLIAQLESAVTDLRRFRDVQNDVNAATATRTASTRTAPRGDGEMRDIATQPHSATLQLIQATGATGGAAIARGNIAAAANGGKIVDVTSTFNNDPNYSADKLLDGVAAADGVNSFGWSSDGFSPGRQWVTVGFRGDRTHVISKIVLNPTSNQPSLRWAKRVDVQVTSGSPKDGPFRTVTTLPLRLSGGDLEASNQEFTFRPVEAKYVRFVFTANGPGNPLQQADPDVSSDRAVSLGEIEIYEPPAGTGDLDALIGRFNQVLVDMKRLRTQNNAPK